MNAKVRLRGCEAARHDARHDGCVCQVPGPVLPPQASIAAVLKRRLRIRCRSCRDACFYHLSLIDPDTSPRSRRRRSGSTATKKDRLVQLVRRRPRPGSVSSCRLRCSKPNEITPIQAQAYVCGGCRLRLEKSTESLHRRHSTGTCPALIPPSPLPCSCPSTAPTPRQAPVGR